MTRRSREDEMAEAEVFETDFWKDANLRKMWDDIVPGEPRKTIPYTLTREAIELYCRSVGETHPIYFDEAYARTTRHGGLIAPRDRKTASTHDRSQIGRIRSDQVARSFTCQVRYIV